MVDITGLQRTTTVGKIVIASTGVRCLSFGFAKTGRFLRDPLQLEVSKKDRKYVLRNVE